MEDIFTSCSLHLISSAKRDDSIVIGSAIDISNNVNIIRGRRMKEKNEEYHYSTAYYHDGSQKRATVVVPVVLKFENSLDRDRMISSGIVQPNPSHLSITEEKELQSIGDENDDSATDILNTRDRTLWHSSIDTIGFLPEDELESDKELQLKFECISNLMTNNHTNPVNAADIVVEGVQVISTHLVDSHDQDGKTEEEDIYGIRFDVEITLQVSTKHHENKKDCNDGTSTTPLNTQTVALEIRSILECVYKTQKDTTTTTSYPSFLSPRDNTTNDHSKPIDDLYLGMQALDFATEAISPDQVRTIRLEETQQRKQQPVLSYFSQTKTYILPPLSSQNEVNESSDNIAPPTLIVDLIPALFVTVKEVSGGALANGVTLVSIGIYHSNLHSDVISITNISLHPGHSRICDIGTISLSNTEKVSDRMTTTSSTTMTSYSSNDNNNTTNRTDGIKGGEHSVINMTKNVKWKYIPGTAPTFPLVLKPEEAFATVIEIHANEVMAQRTFISPICVRAIVSHKDLSNIKPSCFDEAISRESEASDSLQDEHGGDLSHVIVTADVKWSSCAITDGPTDAFHINLEVGDSTCEVGEQFKVTLKLTNLSLGVRDLMLIMTQNECKDEEKDNDAKVEDTFGDTSLQLTSQSTTRKTTNDAVVYEVNNYSFSALGVGESDDGTFRHSQDHDLLAIDEALLLGEVQSQMSLEAEMRFVALRDGMLNVPDFKLYDRIHEKWYNCPHNLKIVAMKKQ